MFLTGVKTWFRQKNENDLNMTIFSRDGTPSSRHLLMRRLDDDGIVIMTDNRSRKSKELVSN